MNSQLLQLQREYLDNAIKTNGRNEKTPIHRWINLHNIPAQKVG